MPSRPETIEASTLLITWPGWILDNSSKDKVYRHSSLPKWKDQKIESDGDEAFKNFGGLMQVLKWGQVGSIRNAGTQDMELVPG